jgi:23S rRNA (uracil1939-C5)-methyltransferase
MKVGTVEKIINGGWGLIRGDEGIVLLNYVLPAEKVSYNIKEKSRGILWGELKEVHVPSPYRIKPPCPYFTRCGGCTFQHIQYSEQQRIKRSIFKDDLRRIGRVDLPINAISESPIFSYRIRGKLKAQDDGKIGFIFKGTNKVLPIENCLLFPPEINKFMRKWNNLKNPPFFHQMDIMLNSLTKNVFIYLSPPPAKNRDIFNQLPEFVFCWKGNEEIGVSQIMLRNWEYFVAPNLFFQVNHYLWEKMLTVMESNLHHCDTIVDLYSGVGFFIPLLKKYAENIIAVESNRLSVQLAKKSFPYVEFHQCMVEKFPFPKADIVVLDPPRSGLSPQVIQRILKMAYKKVIYISCSTATFSRDLNTFIEYGYQLKDLNLLDLFPQTPHMEIIGVLELTT